MRIPLFKLIAPYYDKFMEIFGDEIDNWIIEEIDSSSNKVLDVGGGTGRITKSIEENLNSGDVSLLDRSEEMLKEASKKNLDNRVLGDSSSLPFSNESFDTVICTDAIHHFKNPEKSISEMVRVLKSDGKLIIFDFTPKSLLTKFLKAGEMILGEPATFLPPKELEVMLTRKGYEVEIVEINSFEYILTAVNGIDGVK